MQTFQALWYVPRACIAQLYNSQHVSGGMHWSQLFPLQPGLQVQPPGVLHVPPTG